eukprot:GEMP01049858.1.p1 GENE.GEMP01049858.1~~GEMP01049858.1.p1  ORF type:complete len:273 (+),score=45.79 GEMP01049858.1:204-1022(+)
MEDYGLPLTMLGATQKGNLVHLLEHRHGVLIRKGSSCQRLNEFTVHEYAKNYKASVDMGSEVMFVAEHAGCCLRFMSYPAPGCRKTSFDTWLPYERGTSLPLMTHEKSCTNGRSCLSSLGEGSSFSGVPCCCNLPYLETKDATGKVIGRTQNLCDSFLCVPKYEVLDGSNNQLFRIRPNTRLGGCCVKCECSRQASIFSVPFYIRNPHAPYDPVVTSDGTYAEITNFSNPVKKECPMRHDYALKFPEGASPEVKATLMGSTFLIEMLNFKHR